MSFGINAYKITQNVSVLYHVNARKYILRLQISQNVLILLTKKGIILLKTICFIL